MKIFEINRLLTQLILCFIMLKTFEAQDFFPFPTTGATFYVDLIHENRKGQFYANMLLGSQK